MEETAKTLITLGALFLLGLATDAVGHRTRLPRVTLLLILGYLIGPGGLGFLSHDGGGMFSVVATVALVMVGFLLGEKLTLATLRETGREVLWISVAEVIATAGLVLAGLLLLGARIEVALLLAGIATATAPAATIDVVKEAKADGPRTRTLLGIVAVDDAWGLIAFSVLLAATEALGGQGNTIEPLMTGLWELGGAFAVGVGLGIPMAFLTGRIRPGEPTLVEALGVVLLCGGVALWLGTSFLLASVVLGSVVANLARHHTRPFHAIEGIEWPFMILFFILAGAALNAGALVQVGVLGSGYVVFRILGRFAGAWAGGVLSRADPLLQRWMGLALMPQAGVAMGMALIVAQRHPELGMTILPVTIASTVIFEVFGPVMTRGALSRWGEVHADR